MNTPIFAKAVQAIDEGDSDFFRQCQEKELGKLKDREGGWTLLHYASCRFQRETVAYLLEKHNADPNAADDFGEVPLHLAAKANDSDALKLLLEYHASPFICNNQGCSALWYATCHGAVACAKVLLELQLTNDHEKSKESFHRLLVDCVTYEQLELLELYLSNGLNKNTTDPDGYNLIHLAVMNSAPEILECLIDHKVPVVALPDHDERRLDELATTKRIKKILKPFHF